MRQDLRESSDEMDRAVALTRAIVLGLDIVVLRGPMETTTGPYANDNEFVWHLAGKLGYYWLVGHMEEAIGLDLHGPFSDSSISEVDATSEPDSHKWGSTYGYDELPDLVGHLAEAMGHGRPRPDAIKVFHYMGPLPRSDGLDKRTGQEIAVLHQEPADEGMVIYRVRFPDGEDHSAFAEEIVHEVEDLGRGLCRRPVRAEGAPMNGDEVLMTITAEREDVPRDTPPRAGPQSVWHWAHVTITAHCDQNVGTAALGGCDYDSKADFITNCISFPDLCEEAFTNLIERMRQA